MTESWAGEQHYLERSQTRCQQWKRKRQASSPLCSSRALPFDTSYFTFNTQKSHNHVSASSELPHSSPIKNTVSLNLVAGKPPGKLMPYTLMTSIRNIFCRPEENLSPKQHLFSLVLYAFALLSLCVVSIGRFPFSASLFGSVGGTAGGRGDGQWRSACSIDVPVLGANSIPAKGIARAGVAEGRHCTHVARKQLLSQQCCGELTARPRYKFSVFCSLSRNNCLHCSGMKYFPSHYECTE